MATADFSGVKGTKDELNEGIISILNGEKHFSENKLILSTIPRGTSDEETLANLQQQQEEIIATHKVNNIQELLAFQKMVFETYTDVLNSISSKESTYDVEEFKYWILNIAETVAVTAVEGIFLSANDDPFSEEERNIFKKINSLFNS